MHFLCARMNKFVSVCVPSIKGFVSAKKHKHTHTHTNHRGDAKDRKRQNENRSETKEETEEEKKWATKKRKRYIQLAFYSCFNVSCVSHSHSVDFASSASRPRSFAHIRLLFTSFTMLTVNAFYNIQLHKTFQYIIFSLFLRFSLCGYISVLFCVLLSRYVIPFFPGLYHCKRDMIWEYFCCLVKNNC